MTIASKINSVNLAIDPTENDYRIVIRQSLSVMIYSCNDLLLNRQTNLRIKFLSLGLING